MPLISIITVCKNPGQALVDTVESVINQDFKDIQYIIIDSQSNDGTQKYLQNLKKKNLIDQLIVEKDSGIYDAINKGINLSKGDYIGIIHAGDQYTKNTFKNLVSSFYLNKDIIFGSCEIKFKKFSKIIKVKKKSIDNLNYKMSILHPSTFVKREIYKKIGLYSTNFKIASDFDFFKRALESNCNFLHTNEVIAQMSYGGISTQLKFVLKIAYENAEIIYKKNNMFKKFFFIIFKSIEGILYNFKTKIKLLFIEIKSKIL